MLGSPTTVTIAGTAHSLSKIREDNFQSVFRKVDTNLQIDLNIRHTYQGKATGGNRVARHNAELIYTEFAADGTPTVYTAYMVFFAPQSTGAGQVVSVLAALAAWLTASTNANATAVASWES